MLHQLRPEPNEDTSAAECVTHAEDTLTSSNFVKDPPFTSLSSAGGDHQDFGITKTDFLIFEVCANKRSF